MGALGATPVAPCLGVTEPTSGSGGRVVVVVAGTVVVVLTAGADVVAAGPPGRRSPARLRRQQLRMPRGNAEPSSGAGACLCPGGKYQECCPCHAASLSFSNEH